MDCDLWVVCRVYSRPRRIPQGLPRTRYAPVPSPVLGLVHYTLETLSHYILNFTVAQPNILRSFYFIHQALGLGAREDHRRSGHVACVLCESAGRESHVPTSTMGTAGDCLFTNLGRGTMKFNDHRRKHPQHKESVHVHSRTRDSSHRSQKHPQQSKYSLRIEQPQRRTAPLTLVLVRLRVCVPITCWHLF